MANGPVELSTHPYMVMPPMQGGIRPFQGVQMDPRLGEQIGPLAGMQDAPPAPADFQAPDMTMLDPTGAPATVSPGTLDGGQWEQVGEALLNETVADAPALSGGGGIGLQNTLGILNLGAGLGGQIYKSLTAKKPKRPRRATPMPGGGNPMR